jgi:hypothetical protein
MMACQQNSKQNILQHGEAVHEYWLKILSNQIDKLPEWFFLYREKIMFEISKYDPVLIRNYHIYHDAGKPFCLTLDEQGQHFPNHAEISSNIFKQIFGDSISAYWILHDMDAHLISSKDIPAFITLKGSIILLITALAEIHANAEAFGGIDSQSFKIKFKHLERRGKAICKQLWCDHA